MISSIPPPPGTGRIAWEEKHTARKWAFASSKRELSALSRDLGERISRESKRKQGVPTSSAGTCRFVRHEPLFALHQLLELQPLPLPKGQQSINVGQHLPGSPGFRTLAAPDSAL